MTFDFVIELFSKDGSVVSGMDLVQILAERGGDTQIL